MRFQFQPIDLSEVDFSPELLDSIPADIARTYRVLPVFAAPGFLCIALEDTFEGSTIVELTRALDRDLDIRIADKQQLDIHLRRLYGQT